MKPGLDLSRGSPSGHRLDQDGPGGPGPRGSFRVRADSPCYVLSRWVFLRGLGIIYLTAFGSLAVQILGLVGSDGILPLPDYLTSAYQQLDSRAYHLLPTLCWFNKSDSMLLFLCWGGVGLSVMLICGLAQVPVLALLWGFYLSLVVAGQVFLNFQWDTLLLETGLLAVFYAPLQCFPNPSVERAPAPVARWMIWFLLFKLMFLSGITKLLSHDETWANWTALYFHYETQPLPTGAAWYVHHLPSWFHRFSCGVMYFIEIGCPFLIFVPARLRMVRRVAALLIIGFQLSIIATGNYGFFNWLTIVLCFSLLDDTFWLCGLPLRLQGVFSDRPDRLPETWFRRIVVAALAATLLPLSGLMIYREMQTTRPAAGQARELPGWCNQLASWIRPYRSMNGYGLFRVMTTERRELVLEASHDGQQWEEYSFRWKPGAVDQRPGLVAPHMPRLDWQMWFAALQRRGFPAWMRPFIQHLLEGTPEVKSLLAGPFWGDTPPRSIRLVRYDYRFARPDDGDNAGAWWIRSQRTQLTPAISLEPNTGSKDR